MLGVGSAMASPDPARRLLALIHQYLVQTGYKDAARELREKSGEKLIDSKTVSLLDIYKEWSKSPNTVKKRKAGKAIQAPEVKKMRVSDPVSSSETSEEEKPLTKTDAKALPSSKLINANSTLKTGSGEEEKTAAKSKTKVKNITCASKSSNSVLSTPVSKATSAKLNGSKDSTPGTAVSIPKKKVSKSSSEDSSDDSVDEPSGATKKPISNHVASTSTKAESSTGSSSEDSDSQDENKASTTAKAKTPAVSAAGLGPKAVPVKNGTPLLSKSATVKSSTKITVPGKAVTPAKSAETSESSSSSSDSEDEEQPALTKSANKATQPATPMAKAALPKTPVGTPVSSKGVQEKASKLTPKPEATAAGKGMIPAKAAVSVKQQQHDDSSDSDSSSSGDDEETLPTKSANKATPPATPMAKAALLKIPVGTPVSSKGVQEKASKLTPKPEATTGGKRMMPAKAAVSVKQQQGDSSDSDSSSSEDDEETQLAQSAAKAKTTVKAVTGNLTLSSAKAASVTSKLVSLTPGRPGAKTAVIATKPEESSGSSDTSDSEDEAPAKPAEKAVFKTPPPSKAAPATPMPSKKASRGASEPTPGKTEVPVQPSESSESSSSSDSEHEMCTAQAKLGAKAVVKVASPAKSSPKTPVSINGKRATPASKPAAASLSKTPTKAAAESSDSSDSSDSEEEDQATPAKLGAKAVVKVASPATAVPKTPVSINVKRATPASKPVAASLSKTPTKAAAESSDSSDSSDSEEDQATPAKPGDKAVVKLTSPTKAAPNTPVSSIRKPATPASKSTPAKAAAESSESSDSTDSEEEDQPRPAKPCSKAVVKLASPAKAAPNTPVSSMGKEATSASKSAAAALSKKTPAKAAAESSDSSESSDSEDQSTPSKAMPKEVSVKGAATAPTSSKGKAHALAVKAEASTPAKAVVKNAPAAISSSSESSDSEDETPASALTQKDITVNPLHPLEKSTPAKKTPKQNVKLAASKVMPPQSLPLKGEQSKASGIIGQTDSSDSSSESEEDIVPAKPLTPKSASKSVPCEEKVVTGLPTQPTSKKKKVKKGLAGEKASTKKKTKGSSEPTSKVSSAKKSTLLSLNSLNVKDSVTGKSAESFLSLSEPDGQSVASESEDEITTAAKIKAPPTTGYTSSSTKVRKRKAETIDKESKKKKTKKLKLISGDVLISPKEKNGKKKKLDKKKKLKNKKITMTTEELGSIEQRTPHRDDSSPFLQKKKKKKKTEKTE